MEQEEGITSCKMGAQWVGEVLATGEIETVRMYLKESVMGGTLPLLCPEQTKTSTPVWKVK